MQGNSGKAMHYYEWLRQSKGKPTYRSMLEADLNAAIEDANDIGHFFLLMENKGYEIRHGNRMGFRLWGQERFMYPSGKMLSIRKKVSGQPLREICWTLNRGSGLLSFPGPGISHTKSSPNTRAFWPCMSTISTSWAKSKSSSTHPG